MGYKEALRDLFPTSLSLIVFVAYIALFVNQGLLVTASQEENNSYGYNITGAVLLSELIKFLASLVLYYHQTPCSSMLVETRKHFRVCWLYCLPAVLYCLYNNLSYVNLETFDPTTYFILLQLRVLVTAVIFQAMFRKELSRKQWLSLGLLTVGCMLKQMSLGGDDVSGTQPSPTGPAKQSSVSLSFSTLLLLVQVLCSCLAGVYNEYLLKHDGSQVNIYLQNCFMYFDSIVCNLLFLAATSCFSASVTPASISSLLRIKVLLVVLNNAVLGIVTSFFLKSLNSILKNFASALELVFTALLSCVFFSIPVHANTAASISLIILASFLYSQNPVRNPSPPSPNSRISAPV